MLTDKEIAGLPSPTDRTLAKYRMGNSLFLVCHRNGGRYWQLAYRIGKTQKTVTVGKPWPQTKAKEAVTEAAIIRKRIAGGSDPLEDRRESRMALERSLASKFEHVAHEWLDHRSKSWKRSTSALARSYVQNDIIPTFRGRSLDSVRTYEVAALSDKIVARGAPDVAVKIRAWITNIFSYARAKGLTDNDPCRDLRALAVPRAKDAKFAHVSQSELGALVKAVGEYQGSRIVRACLTLNMLTAQRPGIMASLRWDEVDLGRSLWTIPEGREHQKRGYRHVVPLQKQAVEMLRELQALSGHQTHVFPGRNDPGSHISDMACNRLLQAVGYGGKQTPHGFRHIFSTWANEQGYKPALIERQLGHGDPDKVRGTYDESMLVPERAQMMQAWADYLGANCALQP